ncbi:hypothetical protein [Streptomyces sp. NBC_00286]|uniref:hypothetical protein n=1 Tax=Streptomyces sp. NBC_00286 TaxID=2975701 RepID=UPI002E2B0075|nr:hypothetical protein [Streptomyces sp. NBC_00286]
MHTLHHAVAHCRTLVVDGPDGICRSGLLTELARHGFLIRRAEAQPHHVDPCRPYRELLAAPGLLAVDGSIIHELVYGPMRRGQSRVTWIQALDFAEAIAERDGALVHLTLTHGQTAPQKQQNAENTEGARAVSAYERAFHTLAQHVPVITVDVGGLGPPIRAPDSSPFQLGQFTGKLTVG